MKVAVLGGGRSSEHDVSIISAAAITAGLRQLGHQVAEVTIRRDGRWECEGAAIALRPTEGLLGADVVWPALHGPYGEDGVVQGLLEVLQVPYVGSNVSASALCMDKLDCKDLLGKASIPQVAYIHTGTQRWQADQTAVISEANELGFPMFVKPARLGSSIGITKVSVAAELGPAIETALQHDSVALIEAAASGQEIECAVLGTIDPLVSPPGEIIIESEWYDYHAKYSEGGMQLKVPADLSKTATAAVQRLTAEAYHRTGCSGLARIDFFVDGETVLLSEINTMPGFTPTSVYPKLIAATGIKFPQLLTRLLDDATTRFGYAAGFTH